MTSMREIAAAPIAMYARVVSPLIPARCKFEPSCSRYAAQAIRRFGVLRGVTLAVWRLLRCNPWSHGGFDPVEGQRLFSRHRADAVGRARST